MNLADLYRTRYLPHARRALKPRTVAEYERLADALVLPAFGSRKIASIAFARVEAWHASVPGAVQANRALALLSAILGYAVNRGLLAANPCKGVRRNEERNKEFFYTPEQSKAILQAALAWPDVRGQYIALALLTGCRPEELVGLEPAWCAQGAIRTPDGKTGGRTIYLSPAAQAVLDGLTPQADKDGRLRYFPEGMDLRRAWYTVVRLAKVPRARRYDLRHTFASAALAAGVRLDVIGLMLGHRKRETTLKYAHLAPDIGVNGAAAAAARMGAGQ